MSDNLISKAGQQLVPGILQPRPMVGWRHRWLVLSLAIGLPMLVVLAFIGIILFLTIRDANRQEDEEKLNLAKDTPKALEENAGGGDLRIRHDTHAVKPLPPVYSKDSRPLSTTSSTEESTAKRPATPGQPKEKRKFR
jgi:hypothetical protein